MKKIYVFTLIFLAVVTRGDPVYSQICDPVTPVFTVDLSGQPNGTWISPAIVRDGYCCGVSGSDKCIEFIITLDSLANGINFSIASGAVSGGAMFYQVNCGPQVSVGQPLCLSGPGPHLLTFCKPGNNTNTYQITSIPQPALNGTQWVSQACTGNMNVTGLDDTSITWTSIPYNAAYNSFLSCTNGCNTITVTPSGTPLPSYVDYQVCGYVTASCASAYFCDTIRINFVNNLAVAINPQNPVICFGGSNATVTANPSGGLSPYNYLWNNGATTQSITVGAGTYIVGLQDSVSCSVTYDTVIVSALPSPISANAGLDQLLCTNQQSVNLSGSIIAATGGIWLGGSGVFSPDNITLNATYTPSAGEIISGNVQLMLVTTGNSSCPADSDIIQITISPSPVPSITGSINVCAYSGATYTAPLVSGINYNWTVSGGNVVSTNNNTITVHWNTAGSGVITLTETNAAGCDSTITFPVTIHPKPVPVINGPLSVCTTTISQYSVANPVAGNTYSWSVTGGMISGSSNNSSVNVQWNTAGNVTIAVTQSNSFGCDSTVSIPVTILTIPTPVINGPLNVCEFQTMTYSASYVSGNTYNWNVTGGTIIANNTNSITVNWPSAGNGTVTLTQANTLVCDSTVILNVIIGPQPVPVINGPQSVCTTTISQYTIANPVTGNSYNWSVTGGSISGASNNSSVNVQWSTAGNATVTVTQSNSFGCDSTVTIPVTILTMPAPVISGTVNVCEFQTLAYSTPYVSGNTYNWYVTGGTIISNNNNSITVNWPAAGNGTITLTEANTLVCDSTVIINVIIGPQPVPVINGPQSVCTTTISQYTIASPVAGNSYNWSVTGGSIAGVSNNSSVNVQWNTAGNATVTVTQSNSFGCDSTVTIPVNILTMPAPVISGTVNVCEFQTLAYSTPYVSGNTYNWNVTGGTIISNNNNSITVNWPADGNGTITLTEANTLVCDSTVILNVIIGPQPVPVINGPSLICTATYGQYAVSNPVVGDNYSWTTAGGTIIGSSTTDNITVLWTASGAGMVSVNVSNSFGCDSSVSYPVDVRLKPAPALNGLPVNCAMDTSTYSVQNIIGDTYIWNVTGGSIIGLSVGSSIEVLWTAPGTGEVKLRQISPDGCDSVVLKSVFINPLPQPVISGPMVICEDEPAAYNVPFVNSDFYNWTASPGNINGSALTSIVNITWPNSGIGMVTMVQTTPQGCSVTTEFLTVINEKPHPSVIGSNLGCISNAQSNYSSAFEPGINYTWNVSGGSVTNGNGTSSITIEWSTPGVNSISVTALNPVSGCDSTVTVFVNVDSLAYPVIQATGLTGCIPVKLDFNGNIINPNYHYSWNFGDGTSTHTANAYHVYAPPGTYSVQLIAVNNTGCADTVYAEVKAYPIPVADFSLWHGTGPYYAGLSTLTIENHSDGASQYAWNFGDGSGSSLFEPQHDFTSPGIYAITLMASNQWGCSDSTTREIPVKVPEDIYIPNAFSPNNDHMNDYFSVKHNNITQLSVVIYNRWGERIYSSEDISFKWDGTFKSNPAQEGVYVYAIQGKGYHGKRFNLQGNVTLIR
jgi:gliding motility-associated-like protein